MRTIEIRARGEGAQISALSYTAKCPIVGQMNKFSDTVLPIPVRTEKALKPSYATVPLRMMGSWANVVLLRAQNYQTVYLCLCIT